MNAQRNLNSRRSLLGPVVAALLVGIFWGPLSGGVYAQDALTPTIAPATTVDSSLQITVSGTVTDPNGTISVSGYVTVNCTRVMDTTTLGSPPLVLLDFDFSNLRGTSGNSLKNLKVYVTGGNQASEMRPLVASDVISITCPYYDSTKDILSASSWLVTAALSFDLNTGKLTGGTATVGTKPASF